MLKLIAIVLGTTWSWRDLLGYAVGIAVVALLDYFFRHVSEERISA